MMEKEHMKCHALGAYSIGTANDGAVVHIGVGPGALVPLLDPLLAPHLGRICAEGHD